MRRGANWFFATALSVVAVTNSAEVHAAGLCPAAADSVKADEKLAAAMLAAFGTVQTEAADENCTFPLKVLGFDDADVLLSSAGAPGKSCHACPARLSAFVLRHGEGGPKLVSRFPDFAELGEFGSAGTITQMRFAGHDAFAIDAGSLNFGYQTSSVEVFVFDRGRVIHLGADQPLELSANNRGAVGDRDPRYLAGRGRGAGALSGPR